MEKKNGKLFLAVILLICLSIPIIFFQFSSDNEEVTAGEEGEEFHSFNNDEAVSGAEPLAEIAPQEADHEGESESASEAVQAGGIERNTPDPANRNLAPGSQGSPEQGANQGSPGDTAGESAAENPPSPEPTMNREMVREAIESIRPIAEQCYLDVLEDFPDAEGRIFLSFELVTEEGEGRVRSTSISDQSTLFEATLEECLQHHIQEVTFPGASEEGAVFSVRYPFTFAPE